MIGDNPVTLWGLTSTERAHRIARAQSLPVVSSTAETPLILVNADYVFHHLWLRDLEQRPGTALTIDSVPALAHVVDIAQRDAVTAAMQKRSPLSPVDGLVPSAFEQSGDIVDDELRKRESPFLAPLSTETVGTLERTSYYAAYKGVTDALTKYLWPEWALVITRFCAARGITPNMVTAVGALLCVAATFAFWEGAYWSGMALALGFMVLDTVDGKLARCTITSSYWGNIFDHGIDLIHPPFWWWAWGVGLGAVGLALPKSAFVLMQGMLFAGYIAQRLIEGAFIKKFGMHIHVWRKFDSDFRLVTARRNPNMAILFFAMLAARPDLGLIAVTAWTLISLIIHLIQFVQATAAKRRGETPVSWLVG